VVTTEKYRAAERALEGTRGQIDVALDPTNPRFKRLVADLADKQGIYWLEHRGLVLKVGQSGKRGGPGSGIGQRLAHHVGVAHRDVPSHRKCFPAWHSFMCALVGRTVTIRWQECSPSALRRLNEMERGAIADADPLWERMKHDNKLLKREPERQAEFTAAVARVIDRWPR
jgi:hypothetical protein